MGKYEVTIDVVSVPGPVRKVPRMGGLLEIHEPVYYRRGEIAEVEDDAAKGHVAKGYLKPVSATTETAPESTEPPSPEAAVGAGSTPETTTETGTEETTTGTPETTTETEETTTGTEETATETGTEEEQKLTEKQRLVKEADELGLDSSGTVVELKSRIEQHKAGQ